MSEPSIMGMRTRKSSPALPGLAAALLLTLWCPPASAQGITTAAPAAQDSLRVWRRLFDLTGSGIKYSYGSLSGDAGWTGGAVKRLVRDDPAALREAGSFGRYKTWSLVASGCFGACIGLGLSAQMDEKGGDPQPYYLAGLAIAVAGSVLEEIGFRHLKRAAVVFNANKREKAEGAMGMGKGKDGSRGGACCPAAMTGARVIRIKWQRLVEGGATCPRCGSTEAEMDSAAAALGRELAPRGIGVELEKRELTLEEFKRDPRSSNRIWLNGRPLEEWLGAGSGQSPCCDACGDEECRTLEADGKSFEAVPRELIIKAGLAAAVGLETQKKTPCCGQ